MKRQEFPGRALVLAVLLLGSEAHAQEGILSAAKVSDQDEPTQVVIRAVDQALGDLRRSYWGVVKAGRCEHRYLLVKEMNLVLNRQILRRGATINPTPPLAPVACDDYVTLGPASCISPQIAQGWILYGLARLWLCPQDNKADYEFAKAKEIVPEYQNLKMRLADDGLLREAQAWITQVQQEIKCGLRLIELVPKPISAQGLGQFKLRIASCVPPRSSGGCQEQAVVSQAEAALARLWTPSEGSRAKEGTRIAPIMLWPAQYQIVDVATNRELATFKVEAGKRNKFLARRSAHGVSFVQW